MPRPAGVSRYTFYGSLPGGEIFNTSHWMDAVYDSDGAAADGLTAVAGYWNTDMSAAVKAIMTSGAAYLGCTLYEYVEGGSAPATRVTEFAYATPIVGTASGNGINQVSLVATLLTGFSGRRNRGRMFLPAQGLPCTNGLANLNATIDNVANALATYFDDINGSVNVQGQAVVVSVAGTATRPITVVRTDNKPDIQRRRADQLAPTHTHEAAV